MTHRITVVVSTIGEHRRTDLSNCLTSIAAQELFPAAIVVAVDAEHKGAWWAKSQGLNMVRTEWCAFFDDDDLMLPQHLRRLAERQTETDADLVYPWFNLDRPGCRPDQDQWLRTMHGGELVNPFGLEWDAEQAAYLRQTNFIPSPVLVRTDLARAAGFPAPPAGADAWQDEWHFQNGLLDRGAKFAHLPERTWVYRHHFRNTSGMGFNVAPRYEGTP